MIPSIPTTYDGVRFRSRLEARWAYFFNAFGIKWQYEPYELDGWIPDFVFKGQHEEILVEVKPVTSRCPVLETRLAKYLKPGIEILILGNSPLFGVPDQFTDDLLAGWLLDNSGDFEDALWGLNKAGHLDFWHRYNSFHYRLSGEYEGDHHIKSPSFNFLESVWKDAGNETQWNKR